MGKFWPGRASSTKQVGLRHGFRSGLEEANAAHLRAHGIKVTFEEVVIKYLVPTKERRYTPDFELPNGIIVETKGRFMPEDRAKHLYVKACHPLLDIRFVFQNPNTKVSKGSKTTYAMWAEARGFKWAKKLIPIEWAKEPPFDDGPTGARTIALPPQAADLFANSSRQPLPARSRKAG